MELCSQKVLPYTLRGNLLGGDAVELDYSEYDFIYMYKPIADHEKMGKLYEHILSTAPIGAIIIDVLRFTDVTHISKFNFKHMTSRHNRFFLLKTSNMTFDVIKAPFF